MPDMMMAELLHALMNGVAPLLFMQGTVVANKDSSSHRRQHGATGHWQEEGLEDQSGGEPTGGALRYPQIRKLAAKVGRMVLERASVPQALTSLHHRNLSAASLGPEICKQYTLRLKNTDSLCGSRSSLPEVAAPVVRAEFIIAAVC